MIRQILLSIAALAALSSATLAADLPAPNVPPPAPYVLPVFVWSGFYVGANVSGDWSNSRLTSISGGTYISNPNPSAFDFGGQIGYRYQFANNIVVGAEADASWLSDGRKRSAYVNVTGVGPAANSDGFNSLRWAGGARLSLGYAMGRVLPYLTGGLALVDERGCASPASPIGLPACSAALTSFGGTRTGWTLGAGLAYALTNNIVVNVEYRYADFGTKNYTTLGFVSGATASRLQTNEVLLGLSWKFGA